MKILHIETGMHLYGGALQVFYLLKGLKNHGVENTLVCPSGSEIGSRAGEYARIHQIPMRGEGDVLFGWRLFHLLKEIRPDLVHVHSRRGADIWGGLASRLAGVRAIVTRRVDNPENPLVARVKSPLFEHIITISEGIRQVLLSEGIAESKLTCIHSAVDAQPYQGACERAWLQREFGLPPASRTVGVIAQLIARKGHRFVLEAAPAILDKCPETHFIFFGKGPLREELAEHCRRLGLDQVVHFAGFRDDLPRILPCLDLVVHPALMEGLGVSLLQASAAGIPIVAARAGGIPEIVRHGENGYLVEPGGGVALVGPVTEILLNPQLARQLGQAGKRIVDRDFSIAAMVRGNLEFYQGLLR